MGLSPTGRYRVNVTGARGKSFADVARTSGAFGVVPSDTDTQALEKFADYAIIENPGFKGETGNTGPANSTYETASSVNTDALVTNQSAIIADPSAGGTFAYKTGNFTAKIAADPRRAVYISAQGDPTGAVGAWVRIGVEKYDVRWFGAIGDGVSDDTEALQDALNTCNALGGGEVFIPPMVFKTTATLELPSLTSITGTGPNSVIRPNLCNGIDILASDIIGPRSIRGIWIYGNGGEEFSGIKCDLDSDPSRATGLVIEGNYISFFGTGISSRGLWHSTIRCNTINQVHRGIFLYARNVKVTIDDNRVTRGTLIVNPGPSVGVQVGDETAGLRPEDTQITRNLFFNFDRGCYWRQGLFGAACNNDFDYCTGAGLYIVTADGGTAFRDNWVQVDNPDGDCYGAYFAPLASAPEVDNIVFSNNRLRATNVQSVPGQLHSYGIYIGNNQSNIVANDNSMQGSFQVSLWCEGAKRVNFSGNKGVGATYFNNNNFISSDGNFWNGGITLTGNTNTNFGNDSGLHTTSIKGSITVPAGATSATVSFLSLNMPDLPIGGYSISAIAIDRGNLTHGGLSVVPTRNNITVYCQTAIASLPSTVDFQVSIY